MAAIPTQGLSKITINGEQYLPRPHEVNPELPEDMVWSQFPPSDLFLSNPEWYDATGQDMIAQRRIWAIPSELGQVEAFRQLLSDLPKQALKMMYAVAVKGKPHIIKFLLEQGVKATANEEDGDDVTLVPLHVAAAMGNLDCVKILLDQGKLLPDTKDDLGGTPLMRACFKKQPEIVRYLLKRGADITTRQTAVPEDENEGTSVFEFAAGGGCLDCVKALVSRGEELGIDTSILATPLALAAAAQSDELESLDLVLKLARYPLANSDGSWDGDISSLTNNMKDAIEGAVVTTIRQGRWKSLKPLFKYINSRRSDETYSWEFLKPDTSNTIVYGITSTAGGDHQDNEDAFTILDDNLLDPNSRFTNSDIQVRKAEIIGDTFFLACRHGCLNMVKLISSKYDRIDVNHISRKVPPLLSTSLYVAAGSGHDSVVEYLLHEHGGRPDIHLGSGRFANGPTALWTAIWNGHASTTELLLYHGGPVSRIDGVTASDPPMKAIISAKMAFRSPVELVSEASWARDHGKLDTSINRGVTMDSDGNNIHYVVLDIDEADMRRLDGIQLRKPDEELRLIEEYGRDFKEAPEATPQ